MFKPGDVVVCTQVPNDRRLNVGQVCTVRKAEPWIVDRSIHVVHVDTLDKIGLLVGPNRYQFELYEPSLADAVDLSLDDIHNAQDFIRGLK